MIPLLKMWLSKLFQEVGIQIVLPFTYLMCKCIYTYIYIHIIYTQYSKKQNGDLNQDRKGHEIAHIFTSPLVSRKHPSSIPPHCKPVPWGHGAFSSLAITKIQRFGWSEDSYKKQQVCLGKIAERCNSPTIGCVAKFSWALDSRGVFQLRGFPVYVRLQHSLNVRHDRHTAPYV